MWEFKHITLFKILTCSIDRYPTHNRCWSTTQVSVKSCKVHWSCAKCKHFILQTPTSWMNHCKFSSTTYWAHMTPFTVTFYPTVHAVQHTQNASIQPLCIGVCFSGTLPRHLVHGVVVLPPPDLTDWFSNISYFHFSQSKFLFQLQRSIAHSQHRS